MGGTRATTVYENRAGGTGKGGGNPPHRLITRPSHTRRGDASARVNPKMRSAQPLEMNLNDNKLLQCVCVRVAT